MSLRLSWAYRAQARVADLAILPLFSDLSIVLEFPLFVHQSVLFHDEVVLQAQVIYRDDSLPLLLLCGQSESRQLRFRLRHVEGGSELFHFDLV